MSEASREIVKHEWRKRKMALKEKFANHTTTGNEPREQLEAAIFKLSCGVANDSTIEKFIRALDRYIDSRSKPNA
jgi:hypothetical protein